jgi:2-polyprenyl-3-methyl-5-hydroxy-6-metoxy-1,4-benzoquinol methylase
MCIYLGERLGLYAALASEPAMSPPQLSAAAGIDPRYAREWLEQQAMAGILRVDDELAPADERRYELPGAHAEVLLDERSLFYLAPSASLMVALAGPIEQVFDAFRDGAGVPYEAYGPIFSDAQGRATRPLFENLLTTAWLPSIAEVDRRLREDPPARVADVACGLGYSTQAIARGYPKVRVDGIDLDRTSIARASELLAGTGLGGRVAFHHRDAADPGFSERYDLVTIFEALHDMAQPVAALRVLRGMLAAGGRVLIGDVLAAERFTLSARAQESPLYGYSVLHCLPVGRSGPGSAATGTLMRPGTLDRYATEAGFARVEVLPIEHDQWRFYLLGG